MYWRDIKQCIRILVIANFQFKVSCVKLTFDGCLSKFCLSMYLLKLKWQVVQFCNIMQCFFQISNFFYMFTFPIVTHLLNLVFSIAAPMYLVHQSVMVCLGLNSVIITWDISLTDWEWQLRHGKQFMCVFEYLLLELRCLLQLSLLFFRDDFRLQEWEMLWHMLLTSFSRKMDLYGFPVPSLLLQIAKEQVNNFVWLLWWALWIKS